MNASSVFHNHVVLEVVPHADGSRAFSIAVPNTWDVATRIDGAYDVFGVPTLIGVFADPRRRPGGAMAWVTVARMPEIEVAEYLRTIHAQEGWALANVFHVGSSPERVVADAHRGAAFRRQVSWVDGGQLWTVSLSAPSSDWQYHARDYNICVASLRPAHSQGDPRLEARQVYRAARLCFEAPLSWQLASGVPSLRPTEVVHEASARLDEPIATGTSMTMALVRVRWLRCVPPLGEFVPCVRAELSRLGCGPSRSVRLWKALTACREAVEFDVALRGGAVVTALAAVHEVPRKYAGGPGRAAVEVIALAPRIARLPGLHLRTRRAAQLAITTARIEEG